MTAKVIGTRYEQIKKYLFFIPETETANTLRLVVIDLELKVEVVKSPNLTR